MNTSFFSSPNMVWSRRGALTGALLSASAVALLGGREAMAARSAGNAEGDAPVPAAFMS